MEIPEAKKPSYLNLACTVNGYSNITNYDSKHRENFRLPRSREVSPIRPQDYHAIRQEQNCKFLAPYQKNSAVNMLSSTNMSPENKTQSILRSSTTYSSYSSSSTTTKSVSYMNEPRKMMFAPDSKDSVDHSPFRSSNGISPHSKYSSSNFENNKMMNGKYTHLSETCHESFVNGQPNGKSFIQQRVERLYGPGALAQGFFISKQNRNRTSESGDNNLNRSNNSFNNSACIETIENKENDQANFKQSPSLPVLRHLRPEFRAQLPILSPKKTCPDATIQKSTTVPSLASQNGDIVKPKLNGTVTSKSVDFPVILEIKKTISNQHESSTNGKIIPEEIPAALQVILPPETTINSVVNGSDSEAKPKVTINGTSTVSAKARGEEVKDGYYFLKILKNETDRLIGMAETVEIELEKMKNDFTDDVLGYLRSASGKARLLVTQKMQQFEGNYYFWTVNVLSELY